MMKISFLMELHRNQSFHSFLLGILQGVVYKYSVSSTNSAHLDLDTLILNEFSDIYNLVVDHISVVYINAKKIKYKNVFFNRDESYKNGLISSIRLATPLHF